MRQRRLTVLLSSLIIHLVTTQQPCSPRTIKDGVVFSAPNSLLNVSGYVYIGAVLPVREVNDESLCRISREGMLSAEAFMWAVQTHRRRSDPSCRINAQLRGIIFDTCGGEITMFRAVNEFETCTVGYNEPWLGSNGIVNHTRVMGYVGPSSRKLTIHSKYVFKLVDNINIVTSTAIPDLGRIGNSFHLFPSVAEEATAMAEVVRSQNWAYVVVVYGDDEYGFAGFFAFSSAENSRGFTILQSEKLGDTFTETQVIAKSLIKYETARILVCFAHPFQIDILWSILQHKFIFLTPSSYGFYVSRITNERLHPSIFAGMVSLIPNIFEKYKSKYETKLKKHLQSLDPVNSGSSILKDYWQTKFSCRLSNSSTVEFNNTCDTKQELRHINTDIPPDVMAIPQAVDALVSATKKLTDSLCDGNICEALFKSSKKKLSEKLQSPTLLNMNMALFGRKSSGPENSNFSVIQVQAVQGDGNVFRVRKISSRSSMSADQRIKFYNSSFHEIAAVSICPQTHCRRTVDESQILRNNSEYKIRFDAYHHGWDLAVAVSASVGIVVAFTMLVVCIYYGYSGVIQFVFMRLTMLCGIICGYLTSYAFMFIPTAKTCGITRFGVGFSYGLCFCVLFLLALRFSIKTRRQWAIETSSLLKYRIPQVALFLFAVGTELSILVYWLFTLPPDHVSVIFPTNRRTWMCNHYTGSSQIWAQFTRTDFINHLFALTYIMVILFVIFLVAFLGVYNRSDSLGSLDVFERRGMVWTSFVLMLVWVTWTLIGALHQDHPYATEFADGSLAFGLIFTVTILLIFIIVHMIREVTRPRYDNMSFKDGDSSVFRTDSGQSGRAVPNSPSRPQQPNGRAPYIRDSGWIFPGISKSDHHGPDRRSDVGYRNGHIARGSVDNSLPRRMTETPRRSTDLYHTPTIMVNQPHQPHRPGVECPDCGFGYDPMSLHLVHPRTPVSNSHHEPLTFTPPKTKMTDSSMAMDESRGDGFVMGTGTMFRGSRSAHGLASTYSAPNVFYTTSPDSQYGTGRMLRVTRDLTGNHPTILRVNRSFSDYDQLQRRKRIRSRSDEKLGIEL